MSQAPSAPLYVPASRRQAFRAQMDRLLPWARLGDLIRPHYGTDTPGPGRKRVDLERRVRYYLLLQWYHLSDLGAEETVKDAAAMRGFLGLGWQDPVPDATTLCKFWHLWEAHALGQAIFAERNAYRKAQGYRLREGTLVDATLMAAPSPTQNRSRTRDPKMKSTRKGQPWHFGMKVPIGTDRHTCLIHHVTTTAAHVHDSQVTPALLHGGETDVWGDSAYQGQAQACQAVTPGVALHIPDKRRKGQELTDTQKARNRKLSRVEHPFLVCKRLFGGRKVRYRGLVRNTPCAYVLCGLTNMYLVKDTLAASGDMP